MDWYVDDPNGDWEQHVIDADDEYRKICFCGFREDLASKTQAEREKGPDMWPGRAPICVCVCVLGGGMCRC